MIERLKRAIGWFGDSFGALTSRILSYCLLGPLLCFILLSCAFYIHTPLQWNPLLLFMMFTMEPAFLLSALTDFFLRSLSLGKRLLVAAVLGFAGGSACMFLLSRGFKFVPAFEYGTTVAISASLCSWLSSQSDRRRIHYVATSGTDE
jgi:hypothetical protein